MRSVGFTVRDCRRHAQDEKSLFSPSCRIHWLQILETTSTTGSISGGRECHVDWLPKLHNCFIFRFGVFRPSPFLWQQIPACSKLNGEGRKIQLAGSTAPNRLFREASREIHVYSKTDGDFGEAELWQNPFHGCPEVTRHRWSRDCYAKGCWVMWAGSEQTL